MSFWSSSVAWMVYSDIILLPCFAYIISITINKLTVFYVISANILWHCCVCALTENNTTSSERVHLIGRCEGEGHDQKYVHNKWCWWDDETGECYRMWTRMTDLWAVLHMTLMAFQATKTVLTQKVNSLSFCWYLLYFCSFRYINKITKTNNECEFSLYLVTTE